MIRKYWPIIITCLILLIVIGYKFSLSNGIDHITTAELGEMMESQNTEDVFFIDVREDHEFIDGHIVGMTNIPLSVLDREYSQISQDKTVVIICRSGNRSLQAANILKDLGYTKLVNVSGGMLDWKGEVVR